MPYLPVDTAVTVVVGPIVDRTDFYSLEIAIAYDESGMDIDLTKNSGTAISNTAITPTTGGANDWTHKGGGMYELELTAVQNDTEGSLIVTGICDGVLPFFSSEYTVIPQDVYNALVKGTDQLEVDIIQMLGDAQSITDLKDFADAGYDPDNNRIVEVDLVNTTTTNTDMRGTDSALLAANVPANFSDLAITVTNGYVTVGTNTDKTGYSISGSITTLDGLNNFNPATDTVANVTLVATTTTNTDMRGTDNAFLAASAPANFSDLAITVTNGYVTVGTNTDKTGYSISGSITTLDGLNNFDPDTDAVANVTLVATTTTNTDMRGTDNAFLAANAPANFGDLSITVTTGRVDINTNNDKTGYSISGAKTTLDALNDIAAGANMGLTASAVDLILDEPLAGHTTADTLGKRVTDINNQADQIREAAVNKMIITEATGTVEMFDDADSSLGTVVAGFTSDGTYTTRKALNL